MSSPMSFARVLGARALVVRCAQVSSRRQLCSQTQQIRMVAKKEMEQFWEKNRKMKRPWSPHLTIYGNSITMLTSFIHRVSGIAMGLAWPMLGGLGLYAAGSWPKLLEAARKQEVAYPIVFTAKAAICFLPVYHMLNGIRHLAYDATYGFDLAVTKKTGYFVIAAAVCCTLLLASIRVRPSKKE